MKKPLFALAALLALFACTTKKNTVTGEAFDITGYSAALTGYANLPLELGDAEVGILYDKQRSFESAKKVAATVLDGNNKFTVSATGLEPSTTYYFKSYVQNGMAVKYGAVKSFITKESTIPVGTVDLGIVMTRKDGTTYKLYWAQSNLGESGLCAKPEDYGDYYAWGETETKSNYSWLTYKFRTSGDSYNGKFSKYNTKDSYGPIDNMTGLNPEDDVAHVKLCGKWRMPTDEEWTELMTKCTWTWISDYNGTGVNGRIVTATNGNSIFLPAAGGRYPYAGDRYGTSSHNVGSGSCYWASSLDSVFPCFALGVNFNSDGVHRNIGSFRYCGLSVRPVYED